MEQAFQKHFNDRSELWDFLESLRVKAATNLSARIQYKQISLYIQLLEDNGTRLNEISQNTLMMISGSFAQATTVFYIFISKMIPLCFCINSARKLKKLPSAKLNEQRPNVMITLPERRLNDYENISIIICIRTFTICKILRIQSY